MKKTEFQELMYLSIYSDLSEQERDRLTTYFKKHSTMKREHQNLQRFHKFLTKNSSDILDDNMLADARKELQQKVRKERMSSGFLSSLFASFGEFMTPKFALSGTVALSLGIFIGYCSFAPSQNQLEKIVVPVNGNSETENNTRIENVKFIDSDPRDGEVEFQFEMVAPMRLKGKVNDPEVQKVLTYALLNESNAGIRLATVNTLGSQIEKRPIMDQTVKSALVTSLQYDENPGVRREALRVLLEFDFDDEIRDALLHVLSKDKNTGMRVGAINALETARLDGKNFDGKSIDVLKSRIEKEENNYIRNRAASFVKEIYQ